MFEAAASWETVGDAGEGNIVGTEEFAEVAGGGGAFDIRREGKDDFGGWGGFEAFEELGDAEIFGADAVEGREASAEGVVAAREASGAFEGEDVGGVFHDAEFAGGSCGIATNGAEIGICEESALAAGTEGCGRMGEGVGERGGTGGRVGQKPESHAFGTAGSDAREAAEFFEEGFEFRGVGTQGSGHAGIRRAGASGVRFRGAGGNNRGGRRGGP